MSPADVELGLMEPPPVPHQKMCAEEGFHRPQKKVRTLEKTKAMTKRQPYSKYKKSATNVELEHMDQQAFHKTQLFLNFQNINTPRSASAYHSSIANEDETTMCLHNPDRETSKLTRRQPRV